MKFLLEVSHFGNDLAPSKTDLTEIEAYYCLPSKVIGINHLLKNYQNCFPLDR